MAYVERQKRGGLSRSDSRSSHWNVPPETAKSSMARICDNRLRMIRRWSVHGKQQHIDLLRADLDKQIQFWKFESHILDHKWYDRLKALVAAIDPKEYGSFDPVYEHIGKAKPRYVVF